MNIRLHIERLVLEGVPLGAGGAQILRGAMETELTRLLAEGGIGKQLLAGSALAKLDVGAMGAVQSGDAFDVGTRLARLVCEGLTNPEGR
jgi:hypothetical protein